MDIFAGLTAPQVKPGIKDEPTESTLKNICRFLDEMLIKMKKYGGASETITIVTDVRTDSGQLQKKTRSIVLRDGGVDSVGTESSWTNAGAV